MKTANEIYLEKIGSYIFFGKVILKLFILFLIAILFLSCSNEEFKILKGKDIKESIISIDTTKL